MQFARILFRHCRSCRFPKTLGWAISPAPVFFKDSWPAAYLLAFLWNILSPDAVFYSSQCPWRCILLIIVCQKRCNWLKCEVKVNGYSSQPASINLKNCQVCRRMLWIFFWLVFLIFFRVGLSTKVKRLNGGQKSVKKKFKREVWRP